MGGDSTAAGVWTGAVSQLAVCRVASTCSQTQYTAPGAVTGAKHIPRTHDVWRSPASTRSASARPPDTLS
jgi:hypothetical protein